MLNTIDSIKDIQKQALLNEVKRCSEFSIMYKKEFQDTPTNQETAQFFLGKGIGICCALLSLAYIDEEEHNALFHTLNNFEQLDT